LRASEASFTGPCDIQEAFLFSEVKGVALQPKLPKDTSEDDSGPIMACRLGELSVGGVVPLHGVPRLADEIAFATLIVV
jgi:hypothetical protein